MAARTGAAFVSFTVTENIFNIIVRVTDNSSPPLSDAKTFSVTVNETNAAPVLAAIANRTVHAGSSVVVSNSATDSDIPASVLTFSLDPGAPPAASINSTNGIFNWTTANADAGSASPITIRVTDNGVPPKSDTKNFTITVVAPPGVQEITASGGTVTFSWNAIPGRMYRVQYKSSLADANWIDLPDVTAEGSSASFQETLVASQRFYRILALD